MSSAATRCRTENRKHKGRVDYQIEWRGRDESRRKKERKKKKYARRRAKRRRRRE
jgi:hypothetical protein